MAIHLNTVYLLTGTNMGNREDNLKRANTLIEQYIGTIKQASRLYETEAWGKTNQPDFSSDSVFPHTPKRISKTSSEQLKTQAPMSMKKAEAKMIILGMRKRTGGFFRRTRKGRIWPGKFFPNWPKSLEKPMNAWQLK